MPTIGSYESLITSQHSDKVRFMAMMRANVQLCVDAFEAMQKLPADFSLDEAIGVQLDAVGKWIGRRRQLAIPLEGVYFSFDIAGLGFDQGTWLGPYDPTTQLTGLGDDDYRMLLRLKAAANSWDGSNEQMFAIFEEFVTAIGGTGAFYEDKQDMTMVLGVAGFINNAVMRALILSGYIPFKPAAVRVVYMLTSVPGAPLFGFDLATPEIAGFDVGAWGEVALSPDYEPETP